MLMVSDSIDKTDDKYTENNNLKKISQSVKKYFQKWFGQHQSSESSIHLFEYLITFIGTFIGLGIISAIHYRLLAK
jgi:hypothetical protein